MSTQNFMGIDMPELDLSNFSNTADSTKLDMNKYFQVLGSITENLKDENTRSEIWHKYITQRRERIPKFERAYNDFFNRAFDNTFYNAIKKTFVVGEFYTTKETKSKLKELYNHEFTPEDFYGLTAKMSDLAKNNWFEIIYRRNENRENGILIIECLI